MPLWPGNYIDGISALEFLSAFLINTGDWMTERGRNPARKKICTTYPASFPSGTISLQCFDIVGWVSQEGHPARKNLTDEVLEWLSSGAKCK